MATFQVRKSGFKERIEASFKAQPFAAHLGVELTHVAAGEVDIELAFAARLAQQHGYVHGGAITSIADIAAGYAAMTLAKENTTVLTAELKVNFLRPAEAGRLRARARVIKTGRTLGILQVDVDLMSAAGDVHVLTGLVTMMFVEGLVDGAF